MKLILIIAGLFFPMRLVAQSSPEPYCAIEVLVKNPSGAAMNNVLVEAVADDGAYKMQIRTDKQGIARFCDPPPESYMAINVGVAQCSMSFHRVAPRWRHPLHLIALLQSCQPTSRTQSNHFCDVVLRLIDEWGHPIPDVNFDIPEQSELYIRTPASDEYGRIFTTLPFRKPIAITLRKAAYSDVPLTLECDPRKYVREIPVVLKKR